MNPYKQRIEDIVVPISISVRDKNALRIELWSHVVQSASELVESGTDEAKAFEEAITRLGTPQEIRDAHHAEQSATLNTLCRFDTWVYPYEKRTWAAVIFGLGVTALGLAVSMIPFVMILAPIASETMTFEKKAVLFTFYPCLGLWLFVLTLSLTSINRATFELASLQGPSGIWRALLRLWLHALLALMAMPLFLGANYAALGLLIGFDAGKILEFIYIAPFVYLFPWCSTVFCLSVGYVRESQTCDAIPDWPYRHT